ncbi:hypothetical protein ANANG_G00282210 [Anguilla anguilla]|uniref:Uncharacterized protein n=1 Tax=Anguilla anguilla TaxID=7936 RepID=A0A9D3LPI5_ANGAN|nr:hypothetical protein ANANG_G00282210 [Anguilla anguilla]
MRYGSGMVFALETSRQGKPQEDAVETDGQFYGTPPRSLPEAPVSGTARPWRTPGLPPHGVPRVRGQTCLCPLAATRIQCHRTASLNSTSRSCGVRLGHLMPFCAVGSPDVCLCGWVT